MIQKEASVPLGRGRRRLTGKSGWMNQQTGQGVWVKWRYPSRHSSEGSLPQQPEVCQWPHRNLHETYTPRWTRTSGSTRTHVFPHCDNPMGGGMYLLLECKFNTHLLWVVSLPGGPVLRSGDTAWTTQGSCTHKAHTGQAPPLGLASR